MAEVCNTCGLPHELCVCEDVAKSDQTIEIFTEERSYNKSVTVVRGFNSEEIDVDSLSSELKSKFACGGTVNDHGNEMSIELQGDHLRGLTQEMEDRGYKVEVQDS
jgi:translation initiation factor 1